MKTLVTIHAVVINDNDEVLVLQRADHRSNPRSWNCITGYIQDRESAEEAALRELKEETNLEGEIIKTTEPFWVDINEMRWVIITSLIKVSSANELKIDENESRDSRWVSVDDSIVKKSKALSLSLSKLGFLIS